MKAQVVNSSVEREQWFNWVGLRGDAVFELQEGERNVVHKSWSSGTGSCELQDVLQVLVLQISVGGRSFDCK